ncbi:MAG: hypothetical protein KKB34_08070 [Bacteroidetes bacterium]|nr:hypothetical protein [Bacteroidota bacterium]
MLVNKLIDYAKVMGIDAGVKHSNNTLNQLPQHFADRFGWEELVSDISEEYHAIPDENKSNSGILTHSWGIASAVHYYKDKYKLPEPTSNTGWSYFETMRNADFKDSYICIGFPKGTLRYLSKSVVKKRIFTNPYCMPHDNNRPIFLCEGPKVNIFQYFRVERKIDPEFILILRNEGIRKAIGYYHKLKKINTKVVLFTENQINALGYEYLMNNLIEEAILLFNFNTEVFPEPFNVYDSLGEAYMKAKNIN